MTAQARTGDIDEVVLAGETERRIEDLRMVLTLQPFTNDGTVA